MRLDRTAAAATAGALLLTVSAATAQVPTEGEHNADLSGVWTNVNLPGTAEWAIYTFSKDLPEMTAWGKAKFDAAKPQRGPRGVAVAETDDLVYKCYPPGTPRIYIHPFPMEIIQLPGRVLMIFEYDHLVRQIYTDGREHRTDLAPSWMGDAIGHWEGKTLVVETAQFNDKTWLDRIAVPHSEEMKLTERIYLNDEGQLQVDMRVDDPVALAKPWEFSRYYRKTDWTIDELVCEDNATYEEFENAAARVRRKTRVAHAARSRLPGAAGAPLRHRARRDLQRLHRPGVREHAVAVPWVLVHAVDDVGLRLGDQ